MLLLFVALEPLPILSNTVRFDVFRRKEREAQKKQESAKKKPAKKKKAPKKADTDGDAELAAKLSSARESTRNRDAMGTKAKKDAARAQMREVCNWSLISLGIIILIISLTFESLSCMV